jgi:hypothetical protein
MKKTQATRSGVSDAEEQGRGESLNAKQGRIFEPNPLLSFIHSQP